MKATFKPFKVIGYIAIFSFAFLLQVRSCVTQLNWTDDGVLTDEYQSSLTLAEAKANAEAAGWSGPVFPPDYDVAWPPELADPFSERKAEADLPERNDEESLGKVLKLLNDIGIEVVVVGDPNTDSKAREYCGIVSEELNAETLLGAFQTPGSLQSDHAVLSLCNLEIDVEDTIRHESVHVAQWCNAGKPYYGVLPIGLEQKHLTFGGYLYGMHVYGQTSNDAFAWAEAEASSLAEVLSYDGVASLLSHYCLQ